MGTSIQYIIVFAILAILVIAIIRHFYNISKKKGGCPNCTSYKQGCPSCCTDNKSSKNFKK